MATVLEIIEEYQRSIPVNIEGLIRRFDISLDKKADIGENSGSIERRSDGSYLISVSAKEHYYRQRFTMAHEFAHYVWHKEIVDAGGIVDNKMYRTDSPNLSIRKLEQEANGFAAFILMPKETLQNDFMTVQDTNVLSTRYQVSKSALEIRLKQLGLSS